MGAGAPYNSRAANPGRRFCGDDGMLRLRKAARQRARDQSVRSVSIALRKREPCTFAFGLSRHDHAAYCGPPQSLSAMDSLQTVEMATESCSPARAMLAKTRRVNDCIGRIKSRILPRHLRRVEPDQSPFVDLVTVRQLLGHPARYQFCASLSGPCHRALRTTRMPGSPFRNVHHHRGPPGYAGATRPQRGSRWWQKGLHGRYVDRAPIFRVYDIDGGKCGSRVVSGPRERLRNTAKRVSSDLQRPLSLCKS